MFGLSKPQPKDKGAKLAQVQNQAPDSIPGMFKPGEFVLPPDTVHAMGGKQALQGVVNATHTPVTPEGTPTAGLGLKVPAPQPEVFFANGGAPEDQLAKRAMSPGNTYPQASASAGANIYAGAGLSRDQFGSSGKLAQVPDGIGGNPAAPKPNSFGDAAAATNNAGVTQLRQGSTPAVTPAQAAPVQPVQQAPAVAEVPAAPAQPPSAAPSPSNIFPGNRLQGDSGFSGEPAVAPPAAPMSDEAATAKLKAVADMNSRGESYGSNAPTMASFGMTLAATGGATASPAKAPAAAPIASRTPGASELYMQDRTQEMGDQWRAGNYAQAVGTAGRTAVQGLGMYGLELADKTLTPVGNAIGGFAKGLFGMGDTQAAPAPSTSAVTAPAAKPSATAPATAATTASPSAPAAQTAKSAATTPATTSIAQAAPANTAVASTLPTGVYNHGRGQYSDQASGMGLPAGFTGKPNA